MATETFIIDIRTRGTKKSAADVRRIGAAASQVRKTLAFMRSALVAVAAVRVFGSLTSSLIEFSDAMLVVKAVTAATTSQFRELREVAKNLGATTRFTAGEAAEGMAFLARAGFNVSEVMSAIPATLDLAAAAQLDLGNAADIASNLMTSFGLTVSDMPEIMDTLVFTANNANTTVQQLADGLKLFAPIASQLGVSLKDASAGMAVLGDAGIQASLAGTGMRRVMTDLEAPTGALAKALDFMGIKFEEVRISEVGLEGALQRLKDANVGASASSLLFGKRGGFVAAQLLRALGPMGDFREELERIEGVSRKAAEVMESGLGGALRLVRSAFQNLIIAFADLGGEDALNQFLRDVAQALRTLALNADKVVIALKVLGIAFAASKVISFSAAIIAATVNLARYVVGTAAAAFSTGTLTGAIKILGLAMLGLPFVAILTVLTLLVAGFAAFQDEIKLTNDGTVTLADTFTAMENTIGNTLLDAINSMGFEFSDFGEIVGEVVTRVAVGFTRLMANLNGVVEVIKAVFSEFPKFFNNLGSEIQRLFFSKLEEGLNGIVVGLNSLFSLLGSDIQFEPFDLGTLIPEATSLGVDLKKAFNKGFNQFNVELFKASDVRRAAERDAAILATEEANRRAAKARAAADAEKRLAADPGRTDLAEALRGGDGAAKELESLTDALRDLEASVFPVLAASDDLAAAQEIINDAVAKGIKLRVDQVELLKRVQREQLGMADTADQLAETLQVLDDAYEANIISLRELRDASRDANIEFLEAQTDASSGIERFFLKQAKDADDAAAQIEGVLTNAFQGAEDALAKFVETGKLDFSSLIDSIISDLVRLSIQGAITAPLSNLLNTGSTGIGGETGFLQSAFDKFFGGASSLIGPASAGGSAASLFGNAGFSPSFAHGGSFNVSPSTSVGSVPGVDNRLIAFRAKDDERVTISPKGGDGRGDVDQTTINFNVVSDNADSFLRSASQIQNKLVFGVDTARRRG